MTIRQREIYHGKYFRRGGSYAIIIPPDIRELMELRVGDEVLMNCDEGVLWIIKPTRNIIFDRQRASRIFDKLFEVKESANGGN